MNRKQFIIKALNFGITTLCSRLLGFVRELFRAQFLGVGMASDAFLTAFRLPQAWYKIFAEGPISAALVPVSVALHKREGHEAVAQLTTLAFIILQGFFLLLCLIIKLFPAFFIALMAPGWFSAGQFEVINQTITLLPILMGAIFFVSAGSFLAGALQVEHIFFVTASQPIIMNVLLIAEFAWCIYAQASVVELAWLYLGNGIIIFLLSLSAYGYYLRFAWPFTRQTWVNALYLGTKLIPCFINLGILEINMFIDTQFASFLPQGTISLLSYSGAFMRVPLGIFATAFATISLPHLARISSYAPQRLGFQLLESAKLILWLTAPAMILMCFFAYDIFYTLLPTFTQADALEASHLLMAGAAGLFFFSINRILLNIYYALHVTTVPTLISLVIVGVNIILNYLLVGPWGAVGITLATSMAGMVQTLLLFVVLARQYGLRLYLKHFMQFLYKLCMQLGGVFFPFWVIYILLRRLLSPWPFLVHSYGLWLWVGPLGLALMAALWFTRKRFGIKIYYFS